MLGVNPAVMGRAERRSVFRTVAEKSVVELAASYMTPEYCFRGRRDQNPNKRSEKLLSIFPVFTYLYRRRIVWR
jgi:hypothetical protein